MRSETTNNVFTDINFSDKALYMETITQNSYDVKPEEIEGNIVFDVGANTGIFAALAATYNASKVIAVEPIPSILKELRETAERYGN